MKETEAGLTPIDEIAEGLLAMIERQAQMILREIKAGDGDDRELLANYESLRRLAEKMTLERKSTLPPLQSRARDSEVEAQ